MYMDGILIVLCMQPHFVDCQVTILYHKNTQGMCQDYEKNIGMSLFCHTFLVFVSALWAILVGQCVNIVWGTLG